MVTRKVDLTEEQNETLEQLAASRGRSVGDLIREGVDFFIQTEGGVILGEAKSARSVKEQSLSKRESDLLLAINRGLPAEVAVRYRYLIRQRQAGTLSAEDEQELLRLTDEVERLQAERIGRLCELARLRGMPLISLMKELGIRPSSSV